MLHREPGGWAPRRRPGLLAGVLLAHALLLLGWHFELMPRMRGVPPATRSTELVWLQMAPAPRLAPPPAPAPRAPVVAPRAAEARPWRPPVQAAPATEPARVSEPETTAIHLTTPEPAASAASAPRERLMDTAATRAAIRQAGRTALLSERAGAATDQAFVSQAERQAQATARAAKGDCLKGEFAGGGMGLLSIPFFVVAEATGHCGK